MSKPGKRERATPRIVWSDLARSDLAQIGDHIAVDNPRAAVQWVENAPSQAFGSPDGVPPERRRRAKKSMTGWSSTLRSTLARLAPRSAA